ncbi:BatD family protein [Yeosuana marina]|uniref:BatD family protein n=1 Tax=Yeosuana marina TaxID=1565536 RepID=UPI001F1083BE|nr:BatD family protein [Yeosuana marina]
MKNYKFNIKESRTKNLHSNRFGFRLFLSLFLVLTSWFSSAQVSASIDSTSIKIGEQITYKIQVKTDTTSLVVFPEGQTFTPLEMIESYKTDTLKQNDAYNLVKRYGLTQFDSGAYTIPRQKIIVGNKTFFTDSLKVEVRNILVDSTKQGLYDIKPIIEVKKPASQWWKNVLYVLLALAIVSGLLYWFLWRKKPLTEEEKIALLPPYDRAKLALKQLEESTYLKQSEYKEYYSELTLIIRKYLDEKVYDHSMESTTDELINRLRLLKEGNQIDLSKDTIKNIEGILKRADLVKFAKYSVDTDLAEIDRQTIDLEIDHVKEVLPEPTEEEKLLDEQYKEELERKKKRKKVIITVVVGICFLFTILAGFSIKYGFNYVKDTILGHSSLELLESDWVTSDYGVPPITISTPKVLKRMSPELSKEVAKQAQVTMFGYGSLIGEFNIVVATSKVNTQGDNKLDLKKVVEGNLKTLESKGVQNIVVKNEPFETPNGAEGLKTYGQADFPTGKPDTLHKGNYVILAFNSNNVIQEVMITWKDQDVYAEKMVDRILNSVELIKPKE